jgi:hypothetical protein
VARWGDVWVPNNVPRNWRPYSIGHWAYTDDYGWYWVSDAAEAPWGWIVFHYGRWAWIHDIGWAWVPGREWGPAWVDWRRGDRYFGWAPLPPDEIIVDVRDEPQYWIFVEPADFLAADIATVFIEPEPAFFRETVVVNETFVVRERGFAVNPGIEPTFVAAAIGRSVPEYQVRPRVLAGTAAALPGAMQVSAQDLRHTEFRQSLVQQTNIRETNNTIRPAASVRNPRCSCTPRSCPCRGAGLIAPRSLGARSSGDACCASCSGTRRGPSSSRPSAAVHLRLTPLIAS